MSERLEVPAGDNAAAPSRFHSAIRSMSPSARSLAESLHSFKTDLTARRLKHSKWRHTLGIILLLVTVFLWTVSNFLASTIFADDTYSKPYFVTYVNSAFFLIPLAPMVVRKLRSNPGEFAELKQLFRGRRGQQYESLENGDLEETDAFLKPDQTADRGQGILGSPATSHTVEMDGSMELQASQVLLQRRQSFHETEKLGLAETARLSFQFCLLWFVANYFVAACLEYTTVASSTILTSTSSIWTLLCGTILGVEKFTVNKLLGVTASLVGIVLISTVDMSGDNDKNRGSFPHKTQRELALGDALAFCSAIVYAFYAILIKKQIGDESRVNMPLFFGLVGLMNVLFMWPGLVVLHLTGVETFELPPTTKVFVIVAVNSLSSMVADFAWAYSMLLTSPLITTVGLSMTIPLSLIGQMILDNQYSSVTYWLGAGIVLLSFIFVNNEEVKDEEAAIEQEVALEEEEGRAEAANGAAGNG